MSTINLTTATPAELRAECDRLGVTYRAKDDRKSLTRKIVKATNETSGILPTSADVSEALDVPAAASDRSERLKLAKSEHAMLKAWIADGEKPPRPATPNLDAINAEHASAARKPNGAKAAPKSKRSSSTSATRGANAVPAEGFRFYRNGKRYTDRDNGRLSNIAARAKISATELRDVLAQAGVKLDGPLSKSFKVSVSSGDVIELRDERKSGRKAS